MKNIIPIIALTVAVVCFSLSNRIQIHETNILLDTTRARVTRLEKNPPLVLTGVHADDDFRLLSIRPVIFTNGWRMVQRFPIPDPVPPATNATHFTNYIGVQMEPVLATNYEYHLGFTQNGTNREILVIARDY